MIPQTFSGVLILVLASVPGFGQNSAKTAAQPGTAAVAAAASAPAIPKDPKDLMLLAAKVNGLASMGSHPWHVKANYQTFDADGKPKDKGVFEEWWVGPEKYKISYSSTSFHQVKYQNGDKSAIVGDSGWASLQESMVKQYLLSPLPSKSEIEKSDYSEKDSKFGKVRLKCVEERDKPAWPPVSSNCFAEDTPVIRADSSRGGLTVLFNDLVEAGGHYLAKQVRVQNSTLSIVNMDVTILEFPSRIDESVFAVPPSAVTAAEPRVKGGVIAGNKIGGEEPHYPMYAKAQRIQGMVLLDAKITKAGAIGDLQIVSGPKELQKAAFDAVKTWKYKPYLLNGKPVDVRTEITIIFTMSY